MKILIYKRTHNDDPDQNGCFGIYDCMGKIRKYDFESVIGIGGNINKKINWVGIDPIRIDCKPFRGPIVMFKQYIYYEENGKFLKEIAPFLYKRFYEDNARFLINGMSREENIEAQKIIAFASKDAKENNIELLRKILETRIKKIESSQKCKNNSC